MAIGSLAATPAIRRSGPTGEVFLVFIRLGLTSFGGPIAHIGYFHDEFVVRCQWLDEKTCADLVALCQLLPGPASSQVGIAVGLSRAGYAGAIAAWLAFTIPSAVVLVLFAYGVAAVGGGRLARAGCIHRRRAKPKLEAVRIFLPGWFAGVWWRVRNATAASGVRCSAGLGDK
jgi:hypothetical protein